METGGRTNQRGERQPGPTRERILATARELFVAHTYGAATMRQIAQQVGITKPSLYHHFVSKAAILEELIGRPVDELAAVVDRAAGLPDRDQVRQSVLRGVAEVMVTHRDVLGLLFRDASVYSEEASQVVFQVIATTERATALLAGADAGDPATDWRQRLRAAQALAAATDPIASFDDVPDHELAEELFRGAYAILRTDEVPDAQP